MDSSNSIRTARRRKVGLRARQAVVGAFGLPLFLLGTAAGAYYLRLHQLSESLTINDLPRTVLPVQNRRLLVISPHCDDETLGAGGFIADCRKRGIPVTIVFLTNGDGFRVAASRTLREVSVGPNDFIRFAQKRQVESLAADKELGVSEKNVVFMGYPDRGLKAMWEENWDADHPFRSPYTGHTRCPYERAYKPRALYNGASLLRDLSGLMETVRPTDILVTHPADDHPDHSAASAFADAALTACQTRGDGWAKDARLRYFIVHRGDWPLPQGSYPDRPLTPPPGLLARDTRWSAYPVTKDGSKAKARALGQYESQMGISGRFLVSFERTNELFAELPTPQIPPSDADAPPQTVTVRAERDIATRDARPNASALSELWQDATRLPENGGDNFARYADSATDLTGVSLRRVGNDKIAVRITTRGPVSPRVRYRLLLRALPDVLPVSVSLDTASKIVSRAVLVAAPEKRTAGADGKKHWVEQIVPLSDLGLRPEAGGTIWAEAETRWLNRLPIVDRTGYRAFRLPAETEARVPDETAAKLPETKGATPPDVGVSAQTGTNTSLATAPK